jgi:Tfp pilus assembly PilM family ATPase
MSPLPFLKKDLAGIYFSSKGVVIVQQGSGKMKSHFSASYPTFESEIPEVITDDIFEVFKGRQDELIAFMKKALRDSKIGSSSLVVALPPKDLIIRFFEMPNIPMSEVTAGINFEMKKYIPFKVEELAFDFQYRVKSKSKIIEVLLCGIRQEPLVNYINLFKLVDVNVFAFEPGLFSLFRFLTIKNKVSHQRSYVILEFDRLEANILIVEKGFSNFTRDIKLISSKAAEGSPEEFETIFFRLINEVRVSLDYYRRQFLRKDVDEIVVVSTKVYQGIAETFNKELGLKVTFIALEDLMGAEAGSMEMLSDAAKAYGASLRNVQPGLITLNLGKSKDAQGSASFNLAGIAGKNVVELGLTLWREFKRSIVKGCVLGVVIFLMGYGLGFSKLLPLQKEFSAKSIQQLPLLPGLDLVNKDSIKSSENSFKSKEKVLKELTISYQPLYKKLIILPELLPKGIWINSLSYMRRPSAVLDLICASFSESDAERSSNINKFVMKMKEHKEFSDTFASMELKSYREAERGDTPTYVLFEVHCVAQEEKARVRK